MVVFNKIEMKKIANLLFLFPLLFFAQQNGTLSLYQQQLLLINPAYAGVEGDYSFALSSRQQWSAVEQSPSTLAFSLSAARKKNVSLGLSVVSDQLFIEKQTMIMVDFSYRLQLTEQTRLQLGIKAGGNSYRADPTQLVSYSSYIDPTKKALSRFNPNIGVGAFYEHPKFWISASIPRLFNARRDNEISIQARDQMQLYLASEGTITLSEDLMLKPGLIYRKTKGLSSIIDMGARLVFKERFGVGIAHRTGNTFSVQALVHPNNKFTIGYAYDTYANSQLSALNLTSHEIVLKINLKQSAEVSQPEEEVEE